MPVITPNKVGKHAKGKEGKIEKDINKRRTKNKIAAKSRAKNR